MKLVLVFLGFAIFFVLANLVANNVQPGRYIGKEVFRTEQAYTQFKEILSNEGVKIDSVAVLSSDVPIVVNFSVRVDKGIDFPYGHHDVFDEWRLAIILGGICLISSILYAVVVLFTKEKEVVDNE